jgi:Mrp family chromosome partitioning ATPase/uncharacterized protein involved in exopolysaccharide biosynthesis
MDSSGSDYERPVFTIDTLIGMMESPAMSSRVADWLTANGHLPEADLRQIFSSGPVLKFTVENPKDTNLLSVTASGRTPEQAVALADAVCYSFIDWNKEIEQSDLQKTVSSLRIQANKALLNLTIAEGRQEDLQRGKAIVDIGEQQHDMIDSMASIKQAISVNKQQVASWEARLDALTSELKAANEEIASSGIVRDDVGLTTIQSQLDQAEEDLSDAQQHYTDKYPAMLQPLRAKVADLKQRLSTRINATIKFKTPSLASQSQLQDAYQQARVELNGSEAQLNSALNAESQLHQELVAAPSDRIINGRLQQDVDIDKTIYSSIESSLTSTQLMMSKVNGNIEMTDLAESPLVPSRPIPILYAALGLVGGLALSAWFILISEHKDKRIYSVDKLMLNSPAYPIGSLENLKLKRGALPLSQAELVPAAINAYSLAIAGLDLLWSRINSESADEHHTILVTSAVAGEGKTSSSVYLARLFALSGRSVILVEADPGNPSIKPVFNHDVKVSFLDILTKNAAPESAIQHTEVENLSVILQGENTLNGTVSTLISPTAVRRVTSQLKDLAEIVIFDAPPCTVSADALQLAPHVDTILHVISLGVVEDSALRKTSSALLTAGAKLYVSFINRLAKGQGYESAYGYPRELPGDFGMKTSGLNSQPVERKALPIPEKTY